MDSHDLIKEMDKDNLMDDMREEEDTPDEPYKIHLNQLHCYKVTGRPLKIIYAHVKPVDMSEVKRMVKEGKTKLRGIKKIFPATEFVTLNIEVVEKPSEANKEL